MTIAVAEETGAHWRSPWVFVGVLLLAAPTFLIRSDWPLGIDGTYLGLLGLVMLLIRWAPIPMCRRYPVGPVGKAFLFWSLIVLASVLSSTIMERDQSAGMKLVVEHALILALFAAGYFLVRIERWQPSAALMVAVLWIPVAALAIIEAIVGSTMIRRVKALASVNYMAASFAAFTWFLLWRLAFKRAKRLPMVAAEVILLMLCALAVLFSATRSSFLGLGVVLFTVAGTRLIKFVHRPGFRRDTAIITLPLVIAVSLAFWMAVTHLTAGINLTALFSRLDIKAVVSAAEERIVDSWMAGVPTGTGMAVLGSPEGYLPTAIQSELGNRQHVHPHNILISIWRFTGLGSLIAFVGFLFLMAFLLLRARRTMLPPEVRELLMLGGFVIILFMYSLISGHYTRHWHLYWSLGLLGGGLDGGLRPVRRG